jgi:DNA-binding MarR family transcriptional regulator
VLADHIDHIVADWDRERPGLDVRPLAVVGRILRAARYLEREIERELASFGLGLTDFNALSALRRAGNPYSLSPKQLGSALLLSSGGLTKLLERLEAEELVSRLPDPDDGRAVRVRLTEAGMRLQEHAFEAHLTNEEELLAPLDGEERAAVGDALRTLLAAFEAGAGRARPLVRAASRPHTRD